MKRGVLVLSLCLSFFASVDATAAEEGGRVEFFSPQGVVKTIRQIAARFSDQMVPMGDPRLADPFDVSCPEKGRGRWADDRNWVFDFERDLPGGISCSFSLRQGLRTLAGKPVTGQQTFSFSTGGPAVIESQPHEGSEDIAEDQIFILRLDAAPDEASVLANVSCSIEGIHERVGINIVTGTQREEILRQYWSPKDAQYLLVQCRQSFPHKAKVDLVWGKGVAAATGVKTDQDQVLHFRARRPFMAQFSCEREHAKADCIPLLPMRLNFSSPVAWDEVRKALLRGGGKTYKPERPAAYGSAEEGEDEGEAAPSADDRMVSGIVFKGPFPERSDFVIELPKALKDDAGRHLSNSAKFPLAVKTDAFPPLAKFSSRFGIIELTDDPALPVTLRNIEPDATTRMLPVAKDGKGVIDRAKEGLLGTAATVGESLQKVVPGPLKEKNREIVDGLKGRLRRIRMDKESQVIEWLGKVAAAEREHGILPGAAGTKEFSVPRPSGQKAFEVVGIPLKEPGFYVVEMESVILGSSLLGAHRPVFVPTAALVTNLSAHFKLGRESSVVWVTRLDKAEPVSGAKVTVRDCKGGELWKGTTDSGGVAWIREELPSEDKLPHCDLKMNYGETGHALQGIGRGLYVFATTGQDMTFVHSSWSEGIEPWRYGLPHPGYRGPYTAHTVLDRSLLRAGDTVHMKHIIRRRVMAGFAVPGGGDLPGAVLVQHQGSDQRYEFPLVWDGRGVAETDWSIPKEARLGHYNISLTRKKIDKPKQRTAVGGYEPGDEEYFERNGLESGTFRVEEFRVPLMKALIQPPKQPLINSREAAVDLLVTYLSGGGAGNAEVKLRTQTRPKYVRFPDYDDFFFSNGGVREEMVKRSRFDSPDEGGGGKTKFQTTELKLDPAGAARATITGLQPAAQPQELLAELEFRDPTGEVQTVSQRIPFWASSLHVGIRPDSWASSKDNFRLHAVVLDLSGKPVADRQVEVDIFQRKSYSHRKRLVGGHYSYEHVMQTKRIGPLCSGTTDVRGLLVCEAQSPVAGNVIIQAVTKDDAGNVSVSHRDVWVVGKSELWFDVADHDRIDLLPEKKRYEPGETARFQVRMPFRSATALITVEREGIIETHIRKLSGKNPVIELPVKKHYAPNVFVSALVVRGRVANVQPTAMVDLGKPAFKLGIAEISVGWKAFELKVQVSSDRQVYRVREKARVKVRVKLPDGQLPPKGSEVALAAVDEGLLELMPNTSWQILEAMMGRRGYEVRTATAQMQIVGKRHYGLKALPHGGGGGKQTTRELFDTLLLWKGRVKLNGRGEAEVEVPLNDAITGFRIVAVASGGKGLFGTGQTGIRTTQDLMLLAGLPQLVREGDRFRAGVTLRNASDRKMDVVVSAALTGREKKTLEPVSESVAPGEAKEVGWDIAVPYGVAALSYEISALDRAGGAADSLKVTQRVAEAVPVRTYQSTLDQVGTGYVAEVERPADAIAGRGGVRLSLTPSLSGGLDGVVWHMKRYPYTCTEQRVSRAVALRDERGWNKIMAELPSLLDGDGLVKYFPSMRQGSDVLTAYILSIGHEAGWQVPADALTRMEEGLRGFVEGRVVRYSSLPTADLSIRKIAALEALSRYGQAEAKHLSSVTIEPTLWPTSAVLDWANLLQRMKDIQGRDARLREAGQIVRSRLNFQGTTMGFSTEGTDFLWWLMVSADQNAVRSILTFLHQEAWASDLPRMARGALGRQHKGAWALTTANAWGVLAMEKFSKKFEAERLSGITTATLTDKSKTVDWTESPGGKGLEFSWPKEKARLSVSHQGTGRPWAVLSSLAAIPLKEPLSSGFAIKKTMRPVEQKTPGRWSKGDVARVKIDVEAQADMTWVVVNDPVPAGTAILGTGLGRDSRIMTTGEKAEGWAWPAFEERSFEAFRAYYEFIPKGRWSVEYTIRLNNGGIFRLPPTRVEALYAPEMLGELPNRAVEVGP